MRRGFSVDAAAPVNYTWPVVGLACGVFQAGCGMGSAYGAGYMVGTVIGALLLPAVVGGLLWKKGWKKSAVGAVILLLAGAVVGQTKGGDAKARAMMDGYRQGCMKRCAESKSADFCSTYCDCTLREVRGTRDDRALARWFEEHTAATGKPDEAMTAQLLAAGEKCR